ncbi:E3 ubiquitin-protein ligase TOM1-like protein [Cyphellophora attinorum]|uniref:HECT-type E3 ubiquitin transferase n=1 Tax=Cyphellophora attinorum TaxID=1664694 RepID=A0A0N1HA64_9EURO|nr:E3 ubiquitin-protein ligase TOM1-like protein [Phialophora attinorum]KPI40792.1 E3 ubiquitin-protein ligase TOM1-like protein [Phialophora attinorum]
MGKISKKPQEKHNTSLSPAVTQFVDKINTAPYAHLPPLLKKWDERWPYPRGDLMNWVGPLDRFDEILEIFIQKYGLDKGPQTIPFGVAVLVQGSPDIPEQTIVEKCGPDGDRLLIQSILDFSRLLVEKCANRAVYNSSDRLNDLLNTTSPRLLHLTLRLTVYLAQRFYERRSTGLDGGLSKFYEYDQHRLLCIVRPSERDIFVKAPGSPTKLTRTKSGTTKASTAATMPGLDGQKKPSGDTAMNLGSVDSEQQVRIHIKVSWHAQITEPNGQDGSTVTAPATSSTPTTPTPLRRQTSATSKPQPAEATRDSPKESSSLRSIEFYDRDLQTMTVEEALSKCPLDMPADARYDLLNKLRYAYAALITEKRPVRRDLTAARLLGFQILGNVSSDADLFRDLAAKDPAKAAIVARSLVSIMEKITGDVQGRDHYLMTLGAEAIGVLIRHKTFTTELTTALGATSSNGILIRLTNSALSTLATDGDSLDNAEGDAWREAILTLPRLITESTGQHGRSSSETVFSTAFIAAYVGGLRITTGKAMRVHVRMLDFVKTFFHQYKDGLQVLLSVDTFEIVSSLLREVAEDAWQQVRAGKGIPAAFKTRLTDYDIPYNHRQVIRSIIDMINDVSGHHGANADRAARSLVDAQSLLVAFKLILDQMNAFGPLTWSEVVKAITTFLNNEPTCYTVIAEAGIIKSFVKTVTGSDELNQIEVPDDSEEDSGEEGPTFSSKSEQPSSKLPNSFEAIVNTALMFQAMCLTTAGYDTFRRAGLVEKFFEVFESPAHVRVMKDMRALGNTFDELIRHYIGLKDSIMGSVIIMMARVRHITQAMAGDWGAGPVIYDQGPDGRLLIAGGTESLQIEVVPPPRGQPPENRAIALPGRKTLIVHDAAANPMKSEHPQSEDSYGLSASDYLRPAIGFLANFFRTQSLCSSFLDWIGTGDLIIDLVTMPSLPVTEYSVGMHGHMEELAKVVHMMAEVKPHLILPILIDRTRYACEEFKLHAGQIAPRGKSVFGRLVSPPKSDGLKTDNSENDPQIDNGTYVAKCLMAIFCLSQVLGEPSQRADILADLCIVLGDICVVCVREAIVLQTILPETWVKATKPENFSTGDDDVDQILQVWDNSPTGLQTLDEDDEIAQARGLAAFKNVQALRCLLLETPAALAELLGAIGHGIAGGRKKPDTMTRQKADVVAKAIAQALLKQLQPEFITADETNPIALDRLGKYQYLGAVLVNVRSALHDDLQGLGTGEFCQSYMLKRFKDMNGLQCLRRIGEDFFEELTHSKLELTAFAANAGLKLCLDIFDILTTAKVVISAPQSNYMKNSDPSKSCYFVPSQTLLEFRMEAMPFVLKVWTSDYIEQASRIVVFKLISIIKHVLQGDGEDEVIRRNGDHPQISVDAFRKFSVTTERIEALTSSSHDRDLAIEALFRTNSSTMNHESVARDYMTLYESNARVRRLPPPESAIDVPSTPGSGLNAPKQGDLSRPGSANPSTTNGGPTSSMDSEMHGISSDDAASPPRPQTSSAMDIKNILNHTDDKQPPKATPQVPHALYSLESLDQMRAEVRSNLAEQCNNVLNTHQDMVFDLSDLISSAAKKLKEPEDASYWDSTSDLLVTSLLSMQSDAVISEDQGKSIAAAAHLIALLIQDRRVFDPALRVFWENFDGLLSFLKLNPMQSRSGDNAYPWVASTLLLFEQMLSKDSEPAKVIWHQPRDVDVAVADPILEEPATLSLDQKQELFRVLLDCLPKVGKDKSMALSITRVLAILTRQREVALMLGEKRNLQRLFLMVKQLGPGVSTRFLSSFMLVLRHIIEDEETLIQLMRSEIQALFSGRSSSRALDLNTYTRDLHHLAIRSPKVFVKVSMDMIKFTAWQSNLGSASLTLKETGPVDGNAPDPNAPVEEQAANSVEGDETQTSEAKHKAGEVKLSVPDSPDGVVHFLLSELLSYKDVDDKDVPHVPRPNSEDLSSTSDPLVMPTMAPAELSSASSDDDQAGEVEKSDKSPFKSEEHPIFMYRCFLLQCLVELLHSYNRTKLEFIHFSRKSDPMAVTPSKPRSGILNHVLNGLVASGYVDKDDNSVHCKKRLAVSDWAIKVLVALCSKTGEKGRAGLNQRYSTVASQVNDQDDEPDLTLVRRFVLEHAIKAFKDATASTEPLQTKYSKLLCLSDMFKRLLSKPPTTDGAAGAGNNSYKILGRMMFEKNLISVLTSSLAEIDLSQSGARRVIKFILRPLQELTSLATQLSLTSPETITSVLGTTSDDDISSASSVSEVEDEREETPDLYRNSTLGLLDPNREEESDSGDEDDEDADEEMYEEEEYDDEMDYDNGMPVGQEDDDAISDADESGNDMGPMEGLPGDDDPDDVELEIEMNGEMLNNGEGQGMAEGLNHLLRVLHNTDPENDAPGVVGMDADNFDRLHNEEEHEDGVLEEEEDDDEMDDNEDALIREQFDDFMDGDMEEDYYDDQWTFEEAMTRPQRGYARRGAGRPNAIARVPPVFSVPGFRAAEMPAHGFIRPPVSNRRRAGHDDNDGTNPLLQRPELETGQRSEPEFRPSHLTRPDGPATQYAVRTNPQADAHAALRSLEQSAGPISRPGELFDFLARIRTELTGLGGPDNGAGHPFSIQVRAGERLPPGTRLPFGMSSTGGAGPRPREDPSRAVNFTPSSTMVRWQEERAILYGNQYLERVQQIQKLLIWMLTPLAQEEARDRRRKEREAEAAAKTAREEEARLAMEQKVKEEEERVAAEKAAEELRQAAEAEAASAAAASTANDEAPAEQAETAEPMEGVQTSGDTEAAGEVGQSAPAEAPAQPRVFATIRGRELDITGLDIDREYLDALPEELREEVILQQLSARREEVQQQQPRATTSTEVPIDAGRGSEYLDEFMNALPEELREEVRETEALARRQRERESARREAAASAGRPQAEDMNADDFFATLDPALRRVILSEQPQDILDRLDPRHAAEGREHGHHTFRYGNVAARREPARQADGSAQREKRQVVQLVDKAGVATLLRLMFLPQQGSLRSNLWHVLRNVCGNRQTRFEVISMILGILKEGSSDLGAVERSLASLSLRAKATGPQKTPQPLKRTLSIPPSAGLSEEVTPLVVVQQCLSALKQLSQHGFHVRTLFLREVDISNNAKNKKGKEKEARTTKFPVNDLIILLDRKLITESSTSLQSLAELLAAVTSPLQVLMIKEKDAAKAEEVGTAEPTIATATQSQPEDATMTEAPADATTAEPANEGDGLAEKQGDEKAPESKPRKTFAPPIIPEKNLQLIADIFLTPECGNDTFHATLETMANISTIPGSNEVFGKQLIGHVQTLSNSLCNNLTELLPQLRDAQSTSDLQGINAKWRSTQPFTNSGSEQVKLLHVLKALDYLAEPKKSNEKAESATVKSILTTSYDSLSLAPLWSKLSEALAIMGEKDNAIAFAGILLPLIESLMVVCKNTSLKEAPLAQQLREEGPTTPVMEELDDLEQLFFNFTTEHRKILNDIIRQSPKLMQGNGSFSLLAKNSKVLDFDNKRAFFAKQIHSRLHAQRHVQPPLQLNIRRDQVFQDSYKALYFKSPDEMKYGKLNIRFNGEEGVDAGGVTREWFQVLARGIFNPDWALWQPVASDKTTFHPNSLSWINGEHLVYFKFIGRIIGKALHESRVLDCHFSRAVYKRMLGKQPNLKDLESMDLDYYKSLCWILENDITDIITEDFSVVEEQFGEEKIVDLIPDGRNIPVTEDNKRDYVQKLVEYRLTGSVSEQLENFVKGFHDIIPSELVSIFDEQELELLISGLPEIDVDDWKANTEYHNYNANSPQVTWFWRIVRSMSNEERAKLLQFITGTSKVPLNGFKDLEGMQGTTRFSIHREPNLHRLPTSHTCFNQLDLPAYDNQESLKTSLMKAINLGADYFGFA